MVVEESIVGIRSLSSLSITSLSSFSIAALSSLGIPALGSDAFAFIHNTVVSFSSSFVCSFVVHQFIIVVMVIVIIIITDGRKLSSKENSIARRAGLAFWRGQKEVYHATVRRRERKPQQVLRRWSIRLGHMCIVAT
jgi:hypothetical protein